MTAHVLTNLAETPSPLCIKIDRLLPFNSTAHGLECDIL